MISGRASALHISQGKEAVECFTVSCILMCTHRYKVYSCRQGWKGPLLTAHFSSLNLAPKCQLTGSLSAKTLLLGAWHKVLPPQISKETRSVKHVRLFPMQRCKTSSSLQKTGNWKWLTAWWSVLSVGPGLLQPGPAVVNSLEDLDAICMTKTRSDTA